MTATLGQSLDAEIIELSTVPDAFADGQPGEGSSGFLSAGRLLRTLLVCIDLASAMLAWTLAFALGPVTYLHGSAGLIRPGLVVVGLVLCAALFAASQKLYLARVCAIRSFEAARVVRVALMTGLAALAIPRLVGLDLGLRPVGFGVAVMILADTTGRGIYARWLRSSRMKGRFARSVILVGDNEEARDLLRLTREHPENGLRMVGVVGRPGTTGSSEIDLPWLGTIDDLPGSAHAAGGAIIAASALAPADLNRVVRCLLHADVHVHMSSVLAGMSIRRMRPLPIAGEPLFYIEKPRHSQTQRLVKRALDVVLSSVLLVLALPIVAVAALAIKLGDRRAPVIYRQQRVGRDGCSFTLYKLRTMRADAAAHLDELRDLNQRTGPLFKLAADPRVTGIGRLLRQTSLDEFPQLINVLKGDMSLVGPRPALPHEVAEFDAILLARHQIAPGLTGLWQVEARDNPSFYTYRRLDLFYLENWSVLLDLTIIGSTVMVVMGRLIKARIWRNRQGNRVVGTALD